MLHQLSPAKGSKKARKRKGRGSGSGNGTTAGKGTKGQRSRAGASRRFAFEGGQTPLLMRQPKLGGFRNPNRVEFEVINLSDLEQLSAGSYDVAALKEAQLVRAKNPIKILGRGEVTKKLELTVHAASKTAIAAIEKAGGKVEIVSRI
ncbi:50S ribosomal protein L15 [Patescibacteria group bacterium]|nr:50S ribosomal protein L15 [Patescibacteria group bacterium]